MRTVALGVVISALVFGCAHERGDMAGVATTTSAITTRSETSLDTPSSCSTKLPHVLEFESTSATLSADERVEVQSWANCLQLPAMRDSTVILLGSDGRDGTLFERRGAAIREELVRNGVDRSRILIGTPNAARDGGRLGPSNGVMLELSGSTTLREMEHR